MPTSPMPVIAYRPKGKGVGMEANWGETAVQLTFVTFVVLLGIGTFG